jgi:hypothetical protein
MPLRGTALAIAVLFALCVATANAQGETKAGPAAPPPAALPGAPKAPSMPDAYKLNMLIRTTLIAHNQANQTGNYSVVRDLATPQFQAINSDARLAEIFAGLRQRNLDLSPLIFQDPKLVREPAIQAGGLLRLTGFIPTSPQRILFDMGFERVGDQWRLSAIVIDVQPTPTSAAPAKQPEKAPPKTEAKAKAKPKPAAPTQ